MKYKTKIHADSRVAKDRFDTLDEALEHLEATLRPIATTIRRDTATAFVRKVEPADQVVARGELNGPHHLRAGVDVKGDGSIVAFTGRIQRVPVTPVGSEDGFQALRRTL